MLSKNLILSSAAGSGKTYRLATIVSENPGKRIGLFTYTRRNQKELREAVVQQCGSVNAKVDIRGWDSFLFQRLVRPYSQPFLPSLPRAILFDLNDRFDSRVLRFKKSNDPDRYMISPGYIYRKYAAQLVCHLYENGNKDIFSDLRLSYDIILIDEFQDLVGHELDILLHIAETTGIILVLSGDIRQCTYQTHYHTKNAAYDGVNRSLWIEQHCKSNLFTLETVTECRRCSTAVCNLADMFYPSLPPTISIAPNRDLHPCLFTVAPEKVTQFIDRYKPTVLHSKRATSRTHLNPLNFGLSKGATYENTLIYFPETLIASLLAQELSTLGHVSKAKSYVAITRSRGIVGIATNKDLSKLGFKKFL